MADWTGRGLTASDRYALMAEQQLRDVSPSYETICLGIAGDDAVLARLEELPVPKQQPNLLLGAVRFLGGPIGAYPEFRTWLLARWADVAATMRERRTQTNEPGRCATLLPVLAALPQPVALIEVGASAGLCLYPDRYSYRYLSATGERRVGSGQPEFACALTGSAPLPTSVPQVVWRAGLDLNPLDVRAVDDVRWLEALVWPEQTTRFSTLHAAVEVARADPPHIATGDLVTDVPGLVEAAVAAAPGATVVVFHSAVLAYLPPEGRAAFAVTMAELARSHGVVWVSNEAPGVVAGTEVAGGAAAGSKAAGGSSARFMLARDGVPVALTGPHGQSLDWLT